MSEDGGSQSNMQVVYNVDRILDCHTHLTGMEDKSTESILGCMDFCGIEKVFLLAPIFEDALACVAAGRTGGSTCVVGADRVGQVEALRECGASIVVSDLSELLEDR